jgi:hypothetical protein
MLIDWLRIGDDEAMGFRKPVHTCRHCEVGGVLSAAVEHDNQRTLPAICTSAWGNSFKTSASDLLMHAAGRRLASASRTLLVRIQLPRVLMRTRSSFK